MHSYFKEGVNLSKLVFTQDRFSRLNIGEHKINAFNCIFLPTSIVTAQIFYYASLKKSAGINLFHGEKGFGKSFSFALRVLLSQHIA